VSILVYLRKINWKSLSLSLIISIIINGIVGSILLIEYANRITYYRDKVLSEYMNLWKEYINVISDGSSIQNSTFNSSTTIAFTKSSLPFGFWLLIFSFSFILGTLIIYFVMEFRNQKMN